MFEQKMSVLVTGANGFVGTAVCEHLLALDINVRGMVRGRQQALHHQRGPSLAIDANWTAYLQNVDVVVHCAARVHVMSDRESDPLTAFRAVNRDGTLTLARQAMNAGVKRFIFISSIKVNGEATEPGHPFIEQIDKVPTDPYGLSKFEAEQGLLRLASEGQMEVTIIRPPLIYGPGVKANFASMMKWVSMGLPLPFAHVNNSRSLLALPNLCDFIACVLTNPAAANQVFLVADPIPYSTPTLLNEIAKAQGKRARLFYIPTSVIMVLGKACGLETKLLRIFGSLEIDTHKAKNQLHWQAPFNLAETLISM